MAYIKHYIIPLCLILIVAVPRFYIFNLPHRDAGAYLYFGENIINGVVPYRDIWDHHAPLIYIINAIANLFGNLIWSIWVLELLSLILSTYLLIKIAYFLKLNHFLIWPLLLIWFSAITTVMKNGNFAEEFALPIQMLLIVNLWGILKNRSWSKYFIFGILSAILFLLKPNLIGITLSGGIIITFVFFVEKKILELISFIALGIPGYSTIILTVFVYFFLNNAFVDLYDQLWIYNISYTHAGLFERFLAIAGGFYILSFSLLTISGTISWFWITYNIWHKKINIGQKSFLYFLVLNLIVEMLLVTSSGRVYRQYYFSWLPILICLTIYFFTISRIEKFILSKITAFNWLSIIIFVLNFSLSAYPILKPNSINQTRLATVKYIKSSTLTSDQVLLWGAEQNVFYLSERKTPTRYIYQYPLITKDYSNEKIIYEFIEDIKTQKPKLIIDTSSSNDIIPPIANDKRTFWQSSDRDYFLPDGLEDFFKFVNSNYILNYKIGPDGWDVYTLNDDKI